MTELGPVLSRLGLIQYLESFIDEGFDTWETILDITESDLDALNVKLGHRRKLQREIASARGYTVERHLASPRTSPSVEQGRIAGIEDKSLYNRNGNRAFGAGAGGKRKYRRHPKADENAPERPPSAYVIFSNRIREELRPQNLSFTDIAKRVGENWQVLLAEGKEPYESQASAAKEKYHAEMAKYKKTDAYKEYALYLAEFKAKNASNAEGKRPRLERDTSTARSGSAGSPAEAGELSPTTNATGRIFEPVSATHMHPTKNDQPSSGSVPVTMAPPNMFGNHSSLFAPKSPIPPLTDTRQEPTLQRSPQLLSQPQPLGENHLDRSTDIMHGHGLPRMIPLDTRDTHMIPSNISALLADPKASRGRISPKHNFRRSSRLPVSFLHQDSSVSSKSSSLSSGVTPGSSIHTPVILTEEGKSQRSLPPLSTVGLKPIMSSAYADAGGPSVYTPLGSQPNSAYTLPPPLQSQFLSSSSSGINPDSSNDHEQLARELSEAQRPPHRPFLPTTQQLSLELDQRPNSNNEDFNYEAFPSSHADPLSVLAYAGRMIDRGTR